MNPIVWREGHEGVIRLPVDKSDVFANYVQLLYDGVVPIYEESKASITSPTMAGEKGAEGHDPELTEAIRMVLCQQYTMLVKLYVFSEKIQDITAKRALIAAFVETSSKVRSDGFRYFPPGSITAAVYDGTMSGDALRQYLVDCYVLRGHSEWSVNSYTSYPPEFLYEVMTGVFKGRHVPKHNSRIEDAKHYQDKLIESEEEEAMSIGN